MLDPRGSRCRVPGSANWCPASRDASYSGAEMNRFENSRRTTQRVTIEPGLGYLEALDQCLPCSAETGFVWPVAVSVRVASGVA